MTGAVDDTPRSSSMDWKSRTSALLNSLETSSRSLGNKMEPVKESSSALAHATADTVMGGTSKFFGAVITASESTKKESHILKLRAEITVWEREVLALKHEFGVELFSAMDRNFNMGEKSGGEAEPELVEVFTTCNNNTKALLELRKRKQTELTQIVKPETISRGQNDDGSHEDVPLENQAEKESETPMNVSQRFQFMFSKGLDSTRNFLDKQSLKTTLKSEIAELDKDLLARKQQFGIDMYDTMDYLGDQYEPRDKQIKVLYESYKKKVDVPYLKILTSEKELDDVRTTGFVVVGRDELKDYVESNPALWAMLDANIGLGEEQCKMICMRVVSQIITGLHGKDAQEATIKKRDFIRFEKQYVKDPKGSQEFFHRCVFAAFDTDHNGVLDKGETDCFLDTFYQTGSIFHGDKRLPEKEELKTVILQTLDANGDGEFSFEEIRTLMSGDADGDLKGGKTFRL